MAVSAVKLAEILKIISAWVFELFDFILKGQGNSNNATKMKNLEILTESESQMLKNRQSTYKAFGGITRLNHN